MIIDNRVVITGSFNFTMAAENKNAENLLILDDLPDLTRAYRENFQNHLRHCRALSRPGGVTDRVDGELLANEFCRQGLQPSRFAKIPAKITRSG